MRFCKYITAFLRSCTHSKHAYKLQQLLLLLYVCVDVHVYAAFQATKVVYRRSQRWDAGGEGVQVHPSVTVPCQQSCLVCRLNILLLHELCIKCTRIYYFQTKEVANFLRRGLTRSPDLKTPTSAPPVAAKILAKRVTWFRTANSWLHDEQLLASLALHAADFQSRSRQNVALNNCECFSIFFQYTPAVRRPLLLPALPWASLWVHFHFYISWMNWDTSTKLITINQQPTLRRSLIQTSRSEILWTR